jgi:hypothetical protein
MVLASAAPPPLAPRGGGIRSRSGRLTARGHAPTRSSPRDLPQKTAKNLGEVGVAERLRLVDRDRTGARRGPLPPAPSPAARERGRIRSRAGGIGLRPQRPPSPALPPQTAWGKGEFDRGSAGAHASASRSASPLPQGFLGERPGEGAPGGRSSIRFAAPRTSSPYRCTPYLRTLVPPHALTHSRTHALTHSRTPAGSSVIHTPLRARREASAR